MRVEYPGHPGYPGNRLQEIQCLLVRKTDIINYIKMANRINHRINPLIHSVLSIIIRLNHHPVKLSSG